MIKFFNKRTSESEFRAALKECSKTAHKAYERTVCYTVQVEEILNILNKELEEKVSKLLNDQDASHFEFSKILNNTTSKIENSVKEGLQELKNAVDTKRKHLKDFTIALFGRTKAGKSTIRETLTKGNGSTIGTGTQRSTRDVYEYEWKGLQIIDTPGVEAYKGDEDAVKAYEVIDQSDMIIFLTSDDSVQPGEFDAMARLLEINKYFIILLNVKDNIEKPERFSRFLKNPERIFIQEKLREHQEHICNYIKSKFGTKSVEIIWIHALAAFLSTREEYVQHSQTLWQLSQMEKVYDRIASEVNARGKQRRVLTFFDSTINFIDTIAKMLREAHRIIKPQVIFMKEKRVELQKFFENFIQDNNLKIERKCEELFDSFKAWVPNFVDDNLGKDNAQSILENRLNGEQQCIEREMKCLIDEIVKDLQNELCEFSREFQYDLETIKLEPSEINQFKKGQIGRILKLSNISAGGISGVALGIGYFAAANFWNPIGWIACGVSAVTAIFSWWFSKREEKKWLKAKEDAVKLIWNGISECKQKILNAYKKGFDKNITRKGRNKMLGQVTAYIDSLFEIINYLRECSSKLEDLEMKLNKELFVWLLQMEGIKCENSDILSIAREQGEGTKIMVTDELKIDEKIKIRINALCEERILLFNYSNDICKRVASSLYPAKPSIEQVSINQTDKQTIVQVKVDEKEKGIYIGKSGINVRLAQKVCGVKIEIS